MSSNIHRRAASVEAFDSKEQTCDETDLGARDESTARVRRRGPLTGAMPADLVDLCGAAGAVLTTICWLPQALKIIRERDTRALSLPTNAAFTLGMLLWLIYGLALTDWPLILSSAVTVALMSVIVALKLRHG